jgi:hypothetical protein
MKIFLAHSFSEDISSIIVEVQEFLESLGHQCISGEKPESSGVSDKVKKRINDCDIFLGIFNQENKISGEDNAYTTSNWVIQESGFALGKEKGTIFLVENGIYKFPGLQGDLEVVFFDKEMVSKSFTKISHMISSLDGNKQEEYEIISSEVGNDEKNRIISNC